MAFLARYLLYVLLSTVFLGCSSTQADNKDMLDTIIAGMKDNKFTIHEKNTDNLTLGTGDYKYHFFLDHGGSRKTTCRIYSSHRGRILGFYDHDCNGTPETKEFDHKQSAPSGDDKRTYSKMLQVFAQFVPVMRQYAQNNPRPSLDPGLVKLIPANKQLIGEILELMRRTKATEHRGGATSFSFGNGSIAYEFLVRYVNKYHIYCKVYELTPPHKTFIMKDMGCDGSVEWYYNGSSRSDIVYRRSNPVGNAEVYKSLLVDGKRLMEAAVRVFPKK